LAGSPDCLDWLVQLGSTAIGVRTKEGVVLAVEKRITSPLLVGFQLLLICMRWWLAHNSVDACRSHAA
jgi:hypothetical protein